MSLQAQTPVYQTAQAAVRVIGQRDYSSNLPGEANFQLGSPTNMVLVGKKLIVADGGLAFLAPTNNRVLIFDDYTQAKFGAAASVVIGQPAFGDQCTLTNGTTYVPPKGITSPYIACTQINAGAAGPNQAGMNWPSGLATDGTRLVVADAANNRLLIYNTLPTSNGAKADIVIGQKDFTSMLAGTSSSTYRQPLGVMINAGKMYVADTQNNRVLIYNSIPTSNTAAADVVLGQKDLNSRTIPSVATASSMQDPVAVTTDGTRLIVTDLGNNRVLIWNTIPTSNGAPADVVVGQTSFAGANPQTGSDQLDTPRDAFSDGKKLYISDSGNNRILIFNRIPTAPDAFPDVIIGQYDSIGHLEGLSAEKLANPIGMLSLPTGGFLVADSNNRRLLEFDPGIPLVYKYHIVDAASHEGNGLAAPMNVKYTTATGVSGGGFPAGTYYAQVTALSSFPRDGVPSQEIKIDVPADPSNSTKLVMSWDPVPLATNYRVYFGRLPGYEDRFQAADLPNATATPLLIGGTPAANDVITVTVTQDDATTFTFSYTVVANDTVGNIGDQLAMGINNSTSNTTHGVTATSNHKGTITWAAKEAGSIGNTCAYLAVETGTAATQISPNNSLTQFTGATDTGMANTATLLSYVTDPTLFGSFGSQRLQDNLVQGEIAEIDGNFLAPAALTAQTTPLPYDLGGTSVTMNGMVCPLVSVSPTKILFQVPMELTGLSAGVVVRTPVSSGQTVLTTAVAVGLTLPQPALYSADGTGIGGILALHPDGSMITDANPAQIGESISFFGTGFGLLGDYPQNVTVTSQSTGGQLIPGNYWFRVTAVYPDGHESLGSGENLGSIPQGNTNYLQINWDPAPGVQKYRIYVGGNSLSYDRYYESETNSFNLASIFGISGVPPTQTNVPGDGVLHVATTIGVNIAGINCPLTFTGPNPGVVGVWRVTCQIPTTLSATVLGFLPTDSVGAAEINAVVGAIDSNHVFLSLKRPEPTGFTQTPSQMFFSAVSGSTNPASQPITVNKTGGDTLTWTATVTTDDGNAWLLTDVLGGSNTSSLNVSVDQSVVGVGTYHGTITVQGSDGSGAVVLDASGNPLTTSTRVTFTVTSSHVAPQRQKAKPRSAAPGDGSGSGDGNPGTRRLYMLLNDSGLIL